MNMEGFSIYFVAVLCTYNKYTSLYPQLYLFLSIFFLFYCKISCFLNFRLDCSLLVCRNARDFL